MRGLLVGVSFGLLVAGAAGAQALVGHARADAYRHDAQELRVTWERDLAEGVPSSVIRPWQAQLDAQSLPPWWSASWWTGGPQGKLSRLQTQTQAAWTDALVSARARAEKVLRDAQSFLEQAAAGTPADMPATVDSWVVAVRKATTPAALTAMAGAGSALLAAAEERVARANAVIAAAGGATGLLSDVDQLDAEAKADNLDASAMDGLAAQLRERIAAGEPQLATTGELALAVDDFKQSLALNDTLAGQMRQLLYDIDQASVEQTPNSQALQTAYQPLGPSFAAARTPAQLLAVQQAASALEARVAPELAANACGHPVPQGKAIVISLSLQEMVAYQDGCAVKAAPVTTGRAALPTPPGSYQVFYKTSPFTMVSPWPPGSPFWYPTTPVTWVMEFRAGGYFIHDAFWEAASAYGPGGENNPYAASHGCIHIPTPVMEWLYSWTPVGTPVQVIP